MEWLRRELRNWLAITTCELKTQAIDASFQDEIAKLQAKIAALQFQIDKFGTVVTLSKPTYVPPVYHDYESAQELALQDFKEK